MYNIDFKVSGDIVSIHVIPSDTLGTLIDQMKKINHFKKFSVAELQDKLSKNLTHISSSPMVDLQIKKRLGQLLNSKKNIKSTPHDEKVNQSISNSNNYTFVNLLQQSTINNSYLAKGISSETKLRRKYISNQNLENDEQFIQKKLKFNYDKRKSNQNHKVLPQKAPTYHHPVYSKRSFGQLNSQPAYAKNLHNNYPRNNFLKKDPQKKQNYHCRNSTEKSALKHQSAYFYELQKETVQQNEYNPVSKLNDLIHRSKSLSTINKINTGAILKEKNTNFPPEIIKISDNLEFLGIQKRKTAGKIHHRQDISTQLIKNELINENIFIPSKENINKQMLRFYEKPEFQLKMNYNTDKAKQMGQKMQMRSFIRQKQGKQQKESWGQNRRKECMKKTIYSYL